MVSVALCLQHEQDRRNCGEQYWREFSKARETVQHVRKLTAQINPFQSAPCFQGSDFAGSQKFPGIVQRTTSNVHALDTDLAGEDARNNRHRHLHEIMKNSTTTGTSTTLSMYIAAEKRLFSEPCGL